MIARNVSDAWRSRAYAISYVVAFGVGPAAVPLIAALYDGVNGSPICSRRLRRLPAEHCLRRSLCGCRCGPSVSLRKLLSQPAPWVPASILGHQRTLLTPASLSPRLYMDEIVPPSTVRH